MIFILSSGPVFWPAYRRAPAIRAEGGVDAENAGKQESPGNTVGRFGELGGVDP